MRTILVPLDLSYASVKVVRAAAVLARQFNARLILLHANEPTPAMSDYAGVRSLMISDLLSQLEAAARKKLSEFAQECRGKIPVKTLFLHGRPRDVILGQSRKVKADYIVIGSHGHTAAFDLLAGSTTQGVLRNASCPVLVVPIPRSETNS